MAETLSMGNSSLRVLRRSGIFLGLKLQAVFLLFLGMQKACLLFVAFAARCTGIVPKALGP